MPGVEVSSGEFGRKLTDAQRAEVAHHLSEGRGVACYIDGRGAPTVIVTWGTRTADYPGYPPATSGGGTTLDSYVPAPKANLPRQSPAMGWEPVPQIRRPQVAPTSTSFPEVLVSGRTSPHPRGNSEFITAQRLVPGREQEELPQTQLSEEVAWWRDHL
jgi:hypothetical protein